MRTLVTGATGFLGGHVARQLAGRGEQLRLLVRPSSDTRAIEGFEAERFIGDLRDVASLQRALAGVTRVFHVAADYRLWARNPREIHESNVTGRGICSKQRGARAWKGSCTPARSQRLPFRAKADCRMSRRNRLSRK